MPITLQALDHLVLTVTDIERSCAFYSEALGMQVIRFSAANAGGDDRATVAPRTALRFGDQKINLHEAGSEFEPRAAHPLPGSADLCFITDTPLTAVMAHLDAVVVPVLLGPVPRTGACGRLISVYLRDPDDNLIEISNYQHDE